MTTVVTVQAHAFCGVIPMLYCKQSFGLGVEDGNAGEQAADMLQVDHL